MKYLLFIILLISSVMGVGATAPNQTDIYELPYSDKAYVMWTTNITTDNRVEYSIYENMTSSSNSTWDNLTETPQILLEGLSRDTTYYYKVSSTHSGDTTVSSTLDFSTYNNTHGFSYHFDKTFFVNDIEGWSVLTSMEDTYTDTTGEYIMWTLIMGAIFIAFSVRMESVIIPTAVSLVGATILFPLLPPEFDAPIKVILAFGIAGTLWHFFIGRR